MSLQRGFTLLEMLVVMVLMGLVTTLALPAMQRWHDAVQDKAQAAEIIDALRAAGFSAGATRRDILVDSDSFQPAATGPQPAREEARDRDLLNSSAAVAGAKPGEPTSPLRPEESPSSADLARHFLVSLPAEWKVDEVKNIRFLANGLCRPGSIRLLNGRADPVTIEVHGPLCGVELAQSVGARDR